MRCLILAYGSIMFSNFFIEHGRKKREAILAERMADEGIKNKEFKSMRKEEREKKKEIFFLKKSLNCKSGEVGEFGRVKKKEYLNYLLIK